MVGLSIFYKHTAAIAIRFLYRRHYPPVLVGKTFGVGRPLPLSTFVVNIQDAGGCLFKLSAATERWCCVNFEQSTEGITRTLQASSPTRHIFSYGLTKLDSVLDYLEGLPGLPEVPSSYLVSRIVSCMIRYDTI